MEEQKIWLSSPHLTGNEIGFVQQAFDNNWVAPYGQNIDEFEKQLEKYFDVTDAALVISGTAAIHLALIVAGIGGGDEVIAPTLNFAGCINPLMYQKAIPLFADSERDTWNIDPNIVEDIIKKRAAVGQKVKALIAVHLFGTPCKLDEIMPICEKYGIPVIEDAADAIGSSLNGKKTGSFGEMGIISFNGNKIVTTSGGGVLISHNPRHIEKAKYLSNQARKLTPYYIHEDVGYNYMMSNILAGIGRAQMEVLDLRLSQRKNVFDTYKKELSGIEGIEFKKPLKGSQSNNWLTSILINPEKTGGISRDDIYKYLQNKNIECRPVWNPMHLQPVFKSFPYFGTGIAEDIFHHGLCLPSGSNMTEHQIQRVIDEIKTCLEAK